MENLKFEDLKYTRPDKDKVLNKIKELGTRFDEAKTFEEAESVLDEFCKEYDEYSTQSSLAYIRFSLNTKDEFYSKEIDYFDEVGAEIGLFATKFTEKIYNSKFRKEFEEIFTPVFFERIKMSLTTADERLIPLKVEEAKICTKYSKLMSSILVSYNGEMLPPSAMSKFVTSPDKEVRHSAMKALGEEYDKYKEELDNIYDSLVDVRTRQGKILGYDSFSPLGYADMLRTAYDKDDIARFRANVKKYFVPLVSKIKEKVKEDLGLDKISLADDSVYSFKNTDPYGTIEDMFENGQKMYDEMCPEASSLFRRMREANTFDVLPRPGKEAGGYQTELANYKIPFIFANCNGTADDLGVFTHEFGHALNASFNMQRKYSSLMMLTMETAECHSMSMEFLTYPWMELFLKDRLDDYKFMHIASAISFIPYGTIVDAFQQYAYDNPNASIEDRRAYWKELERDFLPYMDNSDLPFYKDGRRWQRQHHIYQSPFYYIDYCLAQFTAFQFLAESLKDYDKAKEKYLAFSRLGPTRSFTELLELSGLKSPFEEESFKEIVASIEEILSL